MRNIAIIDDSFDSSVTSTYHLSILYGERNFSFAILDTVRMKYLAFKNFHITEAVPPARQADHVRGLLQGESILMRRFKSVYLLYQTPLSVLVPTQLFRKDTPDIYFRFSAAVSQEDQIHFRKIPEIDAYTVFPVPAAFAVQVALMLDGVQLFHQSCPQIAAALKAPAGESLNTSVHAHVNPGSVDLAVIRQEQLVLYNSFIIRNTEDLVFFILYLFDQFGLSQEDTPLILSGYPELFAGSIELLNNYLSRITTRAFPESYTYSDTFGELVQHHYSPLINLARCV